MIRRLIKMDQAQQDSVHCGALWSLVEPLREFNPLIFFPCFSGLLFFSFSATCSAFVRIPIGAILARITS